MSFRSVVVGGLARPAGDASRRRVERGAAAWLREQGAPAPRLGLVLGSGLDELAAAVDAVVSADYSELPGFPVSTTPGHAGRVVLGNLEGQTVCVFRGRLHLYEGYSARDVACAVHLVADLGAELVVMTNAAGVVDPRFTPGDVMLTVDHLNLMGPLSLDVERTREAGFAAAAGRPASREPAYDVALRRLLREVALSEGVPLVEGVYAAVLGPSYETPAEIAFLRRFGAHAVGMSTVPEVLAARARGLRVAALSSLTNYAAGLTPAPLLHDDVLRSGAAAAPRLETLLRGLLRRLPRP